MHRTGAVSYTHLDVYKRQVNIWAIMAGVVLYAKYHGTSLNRYLYVGPVSYTHLDVYKRQM